MSRTPEKIRMELLNVRARLRKEFGTYVEELALQDVLEAKLSHRALEAIEGVFDTYKTDELVQAADMNAELDAVGSEASH